ncbi:MAG: CDP-glycerol glycerophosphotransferase family protein [Xenococcaceae cyanobacterium]
MMTITPQRIAYYLRSCGNLHYFAALKPYLDHFLKQGVHQNFLVVRQLNPESKLSKEYEGYTHLFTTNCDLDSYDLVLTPSFLRAEERTDRTRAVQIFHGMSDKPFTYERDFSNYLLCLCVGQRQVERLLQHECNRNIRWVMIGYPKFDNPPTLPKLFDNDKKTIIYCPTWRKQNISSIEIFLDNLDVVDQLVKDYNLIVKPHPNIFNPEREFYNQSIVERLQRIPGIKLIRSGNVMPWFAQSDLFVGDISAAGYECLYYNRPAVFLNPQPGVLQPSTDFSSMTYLWQCGDVCDDIAGLKHLIDENLQGDRYQDIRESLLHYSVFNPRDNGATKRGINCIEELLHENVYPVKRRRRIFSSSQPIAHASDSFD